MFRTSLTDGCVTSADIMHGFEKCSWCVTFKLLDAVHIDNDVP